MNMDKKITWAGMLNLFVVYIVWGSTYLAIRVAVRDGAGFPPFTLGAMRVLIAGVVLLFWAFLTRKRVRPTRRELVTLAISGVLLWVGGNGLVNWAEQRAHSGLATLIIAATPLWVAIMEALIDRRWPSLRLILAIIVGCFGIAVLSVPVLREGVQADVPSIIGLLFAGFSWGMGTLFQSRRSVDVDPSVSSGYQQVFGGIGFVVIALLSHEPLPTPVPQAWLAWGYLVIFGSLLAFTSYVRAVQMLPTSIVMTYPYVNPVIAVFLGWLILNEPITVWTIAGAALVLLGVAGVFDDRKRRAADRV